MRVTDNRSLVLHHRPAEVEDGNVAVPHGFVESGISSNAFACALYLASFDGAEGSPDLLVQAWANIQDLKPWTADAARRELEERGHLIIAGDHWHLSLSGFSEAERDALTA
ncbi:hypothetical protein [Rhodococcus koreensis]|uniref:hypothetical protein n=1 Tax=Rhodococcus koreensis TaxID=99653 RepID=UPI003670C805